MNKQEFMQIATGIIAAYPNTKILADTASLDFWYRMLRDLDYRVAQNAVLEHISTKQFSPSIGDIRKLCMERSGKSIPSFDEAWGTVQKAISQFGFFEPEKAYATMDEITRTVVKSFGWTNLCTSSNQITDRANFREAYEKKANEYLEHRQLPEFVKQEKAALIAELSPPEEQMITADKTTVVAIECTDRAEAPAGMMDKVRREIYGSER